MKRINELNDLLNDSNSNSTKIKEQIQNEWNKIFNDSGAVKKAIEGLESSNNYQFNTYDDIETWFCPSGLDHFPADYLGEYFQDQYYFSYSQDYGCNPILSQTVGCQGESYCVYDSYRDSGIYHNSKKLCESNDDNAFEIIEESMEKEGVYSGVYYCDAHGGIELHKEYYQWLEAKNKKDDAV